MTIPPHHTIIFFQIKSGHVLKYLKHIVRWLPQTGTFLEIQSSRSWFLRSLKWKVAWRRCSIPSSISYFLVILCWPLIVFLIFNNNWELKNMKSMCCARGIKTKEDLIQLTHELESSRIYHAISQLWSLKNGSEMIIVFMHRIVSGCPPFKRAIKKRWHCGNTYPIIEGLLC